MTTTVPTMSVKVVQEITHQRISDLLIGAFEGGSDYWMAGYQVVKNVAKKDYERLGNSVGVEGAINRYSFLPLLPDNGLIIKLQDPHDVDPEKIAVLNLESIQKGLQVLADKYPHHLRDIISENDDANTADCLVQAAIFGELVYG